MLREMKEHIFEMSNKGIIKIDTRALDEMFLYKQEKKEMEEAGGVLLGRFIKESKNIIIDKITVPMIGDLRSRYSFKRAAKMHQIIIDREWEKSKGTCNYLGEWHTHPENYPTPSSVDKNDWKRKLKGDIYSSRYLYFIIIGIKELVIWEGDRRTLKLKQLY